MQALVEIIYEDDSDKPARARPVDPIVASIPRELERQCVRPEWWCIWRGRIFVREHRMAGRCIEVTNLIVSTPPKFALVPLDEARSLDAFCESARRVIVRNVNLYSCLQMWTARRCSLVEALRGACWANIEGIARMQEIAPVWCAALSLEADTAEEWLGRAAECALAHQDALSRMTRWRELQNPRPIQVGDQMLVYTPPLYLEEWRRLELSKIKMMDSKTGAA